MLKSSVAYSLCIPCVHELEFVLPIGYTCLKKWWNWIAMYSGKDNMLPSENEAQRLKNSLRNCTVRYFKDNGHTILLVGEEFFSFGYLIMLLVFSKITICFLWLVIVLSIYNIHSKFNWMVAVESLNIVISKFEIWSNSQLFFLFLW